MDSFNHFIRRSWADWEEDVQESTMCLFDTKVLSSPKEALAHMKSAHNFDLAKLRKDKGTYLKLHSVQLQLLTTHNRIGFLSNYRID